MCTLAGLFYRERALIEISALIITRLVYFKIAQLTLNELCRI